MKCNDAFVVVVNGGVESIQLQSITSASVTCNRSHHGNNGRILIESIGSDDSSSYLDVSHDDDDDDDADTETSKA